ncbi:MAG: DNA-directed RNA polymerase subunit E, RpoE2 [Candidatus Parvarchaeum acidiphilum ARMAN-4]|jgi:DNA-directed RNA polymerase subunit E"|uniref:Transcription elongation factor Spt4 n=1 Tax=Candidatus Parvarchaeum acidiphilum ARMAN-4 TaxID=662760 RepID=D2EF28_PARA4|nr:MAG: DNA-directed RNA polymerase subunit E, RpoE2 [Candidatus Parvarchaeum acidiphilum ARMAN-4]
MALKACKVCNYLTEERKCPMCGSEDLSLKWKGVVIISDKEKSKIAEAMNIGKNGKYAISVE